MGTPSQARWSAPHNTAFSAELGTSLAGDNWLTGQSAMSMHQYAHRAVTRIAVLLKCPRSANMASARAQTTSTCRQDQTLGCFATCVTCRPVLAQ